MLAETSFQAALMMPMAIALAFGILFATTMTLILIPCVYVIMDDATALTRRLLRGTESIQT
jgi:multidrug efflux pump subunit AcrB